MNAAAGVISLPQKASVRLAMQMATASPERRDGLRKEWAAALAADARDDARSIIASRLGRAKAAAIRVREVFSATPGPIRGES